MKYIIKGDTVVTYALSIFLMLFLNACSYTNYPKNNVVLEQSKEIKNNTTEYRTIVVAEKTSYKSIHDNKISPYSNLYNNNNCRNNVNCKCGKH